LEERGEEDMKTLRDVPVRPVPVVGPRTALDEAIRLMQEEPLRAVALVGDGTYMGIFNQEALEDTNLIPPGANLSLLEVGPYVHPVGLIGRPDLPVRDALALMTRKGLGVIPVVDNNTFRGVVTREDLELALT
jgi:predicted transcriptional regulator